MKLSQRLCVIFSVLLTVFLVICFVENELKSSDLTEGENSAHGRQHFIFHRRFLNRDENSKISAEAPNHPMNVIPLPPKSSNKKNDTTTTVSTTKEPRDEFLDLRKYTTLNPNFRQYMEWPPYFRLPKHNPTLADVLKVKIRSNMTNWEKFHLQISKYYLFPENSKVVDDLLHDLATQKIIGVEQLPGGTQLKLILTMEDGAKALFKPMRFPREVETLPNHFYFTDFERHVSEIASFHLDKLLGFRRTPPCVGRKVNISEELYPLVEPDLHKTFFISPAGNVCFHGQCTYYCDTSHAICGDPHMLEGSLSVWLPPRNVLERKPIRSPWRRSYNKRRKAAWETDSFYCVNQVKTVAPYNHGRRIYDLMDLHIMDYLTGNMDRHHYDEIQTFGNDSALIHLDNGRGFGKYSDDEFTIILPLLQCCVVRLSTFNRLYSFHIGPKRLSDLMRESMANDPVAPVLIESHLEALDRRVEKILECISSCIKVNEPAGVLLDDVLDYPFYRNMTIKIVPD
ncbi:extracellular serine/threonine protein CG31145-like isoform X1 [Argiope bruennichi]|uniref:extracellular serine/threonine protein CG31145-like isoform X1 n=1 Tax=Argiope bruennichi TaxID=94029 RepID=UPI0024945EAA|nr:extracellular serine/threonine protein CG31145-like isoform X1 [Argiope bruennichi]